MAPPNLKGEIGTWFPSSPLVQSQYLEKYREKKGLKKKWRIVFWDVECPGFSNRGCNCEAQKIWGLLGEGSSEFFRNFRRGDIPCARRWWSTSLPDWWNLLIIQMLDMHAVPMVCGARALFYSRNAASGATAWWKLVVPILRFWISF